MAKMTIQQLKDRWETDDGKVLLNNVIKAIKKGTILNKVPSIDLHEGKIDLRGISFPKEYSEYFNYKTSKNVKWATDSLRFKNCKLENIDFSYSDIECTYWKKCFFISCLFYQVNARAITFKACDFEHVIFKNTRFSYGHLNIRVGNLSGSFKHVSFIKSQFSETHFSFPIIENCLFRDCNLNAADFDGSRFINTKFTGKVNSPWFRKHSIREYETNLFFNMIDKTKFTNEMINVDFSEAILEYVGITEDLDLKSCTLPKHTKISTLKDHHDQDVYYIHSEPIQQDFK